METDPLIYSFFLIFGCAAILATLALMTRQPLIIAYVAVGVILGPSGTALITDPSLIYSIANIGIIFLLFLLGLDMQPDKLLTVLKEAAAVTLASCFLFACGGFLVGFLFGFTVTECIVIGIATMFSSTIIGIKLIPTTVLHHRHTGELVISILLIQDLIAIVVLLVIGSGMLSGEPPIQLLYAAIALPMLLLFAWAVVKYILLRLLASFDAFHEYIFLLAIGWCLGLAEIAHLAGLSREIGAFIAGVSIATSPIALYIANNLKPLRDFFLVLFFFSLGAGFDPAILPEIVVPTLLLSLVVLVGKPAIFRALLGRASETVNLAWEIGFRLGQISEFSLLVGFIAVSGGLIGREANHLIEATAIVTFLISTYSVVFRYPTPIAISDRLRRD